MAAVGTIDQDAASSSAGSRDLVLGAVSVVLMLWLILPAFGPIHLEGFSAEIERLALLRSRGLLDRATDTFAYVTTYFYLSRFGVIDLLSRLIDLGLRSEVAFRVLSVSAWLVFYATSIAFVRHWTRQPWLIAALGVTLVSAATLTGGYFNDNVVASAFSTTALLCLSRSAKPAAAVIAGALSGAALVCRLDFLYMAPACALILWMREPVFGRFAVKGLLAALAAIAVAFLWTYANGLDLLGMVAAARKYAGNWNMMPPQARNALIEIVVFAGLVGALLATVGVVSLVRARNWRLLIVLIVPMVVYTGLLFRLLSQARSLLYLTPFAGGLIALGIAATLAFLRSSSRNERRAGTWIAVAAVALLVAPPWYRFSDGPRSAWGNVWTVAAWLQFQHDYARDMARLGDEAVAGARRGAVLMADDWNSDRYTELALTKAGTPIGNAPAPAACKPVSSWFQAPDGQRMLSMRTSTSFATNYYFYILAASYAQRVFPCALGERATEYLWLSAMAGDRRYNNPNATSAKMTWDALRVPPSAESLPAWERALAFALPAPLATYTWARPMGRDKLASVGRYWQQVEANTRRQLTPPPGVPGPHPQEPTLASFDSYYVSPPLPHARW